MLNLNTYLCAKILSEFYVGGQKEIPCQYVTVEPTPKSHLA